MKSRVLILAVLALGMLCSAAVRAQSLADEVARVERLIAEKHPQEALDLAKRLVTENPTSDQAWWAQARARRELGDARGALDDYSKAIAINPVNVRAYTGRATALDTLGRREEALRDVNRAIAINPRYPNAYDTRAMLKVRAGDAKGALEDCTRAIEIDPKLVSALTRRAEINLHLGNFEAAIRDATAALSLSPGLANTIEQRGYSFLQLKRYREAIADYTRSIELGHHVAASYNDRAYCHRMLGELSEALADVRKSVELGPDDQTATRNLREIQALQASIGPAAAAAGRAASPTAESPAKPAPPKVGAASVPAAAASSQGPRVLAPFPGYAMADPCKQAEALPGVPWRPDASPASGTIGSARLGQYEALIRHTMKGLRLLYGTLTPTEEKSFNAFWAPYFNHPTPEALGYFQKITPLLDDMTVTLANLDGLLPGMGEALQGTMLAGGDPASGAACVAAVQYQRVKAERARLNDLSKKISALGNPPNPLAAKCAARQHHRKAVPAKEAPQGEGHDFAYFLNKAQQEEAERTRRTNPVGIRKANASNAIAVKEGNAVRNLMNSGGANDAAYQRLYADFGARRKAADALAAEESAAVNELLKSGTATDAAYNALYAGFEGRWQAVVNGTPVAAAQGAVVVAGAPAENSAVGAQPAAKTGSQTADPETDPQVNAEAIAEHLALAEQTRRQADRWAADAKNEKDSTKSKWMQDQAAGMYANAQSELDIAESLRTGTMVHTRTAWDEQQHQTTVSNIKKELTVFDAENKLLANLPKVADMVTGLDGVQLREQMEKDITEAIQSPDAVKKLAAIYGRVQDKVAEQGQQQIEYAQERVDRWERRIAVAEKVEMAAGMSVTLGALWAPAEVGTLALGYAGSTGFAEGGVKGATVAVVRSVSSRADAIISAYEGATKIDPVTHEPGGVWGAVEGALWSIGTNKAMEAIGGRIQEAKAEYTAAQKAAAAPIEKANAENALAQQAAGTPGVKAVANAGEGKLKEFDFQTPEQRYKAALESAKTPQEQASVSQKYAIQEKRQAMGSEKDAALQRADDAVRQGADSEKAKAQYSQDLDAIDAKYAVRDSRNQEHQEVMKELGYDPVYSDNNMDIKPTGSKPKTPESDMDFTPVGDTPHEAYQKGKAYTDALKRRGHNIDEYGDRWVDTTNDATIWKPGFGADKPGSSSFAAEVIFGTLPNSDKFGTKGGFEWTSTGDTGDPLGAVLANAGKAVGAGLGNSRPPDLHVIGKSAAKAVEILAQQKIPIKVDPTLQAQITALKGHQTPELAGVVELGVDQATKDQQVKSFLEKAQALMGQAIALAKDKSDAKALELNQTAAASTPDQAYKIRSKVQTYQASDKAAMDTIAQASPALAAAMGKAVKPADLPLSGPAININVGGLTRSLASDRDGDAQAPPVPADGTDPAFKDLAKRCAQAAQTAGTKLAAAKPGSDEAKYLADLKTALEQGAKNPAEAVRSVRGLSGTELAVVLAQLGAPAK